MVDDLIMNREKNALVIVRFGCLFVKEYLMTTAWVLKVKPKMKRKIVDQIKGSVVSWRKNSMELRKEVSVVLMICQVLAQFACLDLTYWYNGIRRCFKERGFPLGLASQV